MNIKNFKQDLKELLIKHNVSIGVDIKGDTHGISENFIVIDSNNKETIINHYSAYIDASDL